MKPNIEIKPERLYAWVNGVKVGEFGREQGQYMFHHHAAADRLKQDEKEALAIEVKNYLALLNITKRLLS